MLVQGIFWVSLHGREIFGGFNLCPHSHLRVNWNPGYPPGGSKKAIPVHKKLIISVFNYVWPWWKWIPTWICRSDVFNFFPCVLDNIDKTDSSIESSRVLLTSCCWSRSNSFWGKVLSHTKLTNFHDTPALTCSCFFFLLSVLWQVGAELVKLGFSRVCVLEEPGLSTLRTQGILTVPTWSDLWSNAPTSTIQSKLVYTCNSRFRFLWAKRETRESTVGTRARKFLAKSKRERLLRKLNQNTTRTLGTASKV